MIPFCAALLFPFLFLIGCAPAPSTFYLAPEYRNNRESEVSIVVLQYIGKLMTAEQWESFIARKTKEQKLVTNTEVEKRTRLLAPPTKEQYLKVLEEFVDSIVKNSPLAQKTISY